MALYDRVTGDLKAAMKSGDRARVEALRFALAHINSFQKDKQAKQPGALITDEELVSVLQKEAKRKKESIELFRRGNRGDLVLKEEGDLAIISAYLPKELSRAEIEGMVDRAIAGGAKEFSSVMRDVMASVKGRADVKAVSEIIKSKLDAQ